MSEGQVDYRVERNYSEKTILTIESDRHVYYFDMVAGTKIIRIFRDGFFLKKFKDFSEAFLWLQEMLHFERLQITK